MALKLNTQMHREFHIDNVESDNGNYITLSLSSEFPAPREFGNEVLLHGPENIDMSRAGQASGLPLLLNHEKEALPTGRIKNLRVGPDKKLRGDAYFSGSPMGQQVKADVQNGIITDTSLGYIVKAFKVQKGDGQSPDTYNVTRWMPYEGSLVGVPMDPGVGVGRSMGGDLDADLDGQDQPDAAPKDGTLATGLGEGTSGATSELDTPDLQLGEDARVLRRAELIRELGLLDGMIDVATSPDGNLENTSDTGVDPGAAAAQTSNQSDPTAVSTESDDDNSLYYQRSADFTDDPISADEQRADQEPYGEVDYADPGYQADQKKRYPIDTKEHALAANSYIHKKVNAAKYSPADLHKVVAKITAALHQFGVDVPAGETKGLEPCGSAEDTRMLGGDKPTPDGLDPLPTESAPGTTDLLDAPVPETQPYPALAPTESDKVPPDVQLEPNPGLLEVAPETVALLGAPKPDAPPIDGIGELNPDNARSMEVDSELLSSPGGLGSPEVAALRTIALKFNTSRTASEIDGILSTRSLSEARSLLLTPPEPPSKQVRYEPGRPKMLTNQILNRAMSAAVLGNWDVLNADDSSVKEVLKRTGERAFSVDLFHESVGGADFQKARQRALSGGQMMQRDMTTSNDANAVFQVPIGFIDYLFARTALLKAGARVKTGVGSLAYMRASAPIAQTAQGEDAGSPGATGMQFVKVPYLPHAIVAKVPITQELQKEAAFDLQPIIRQDVSKAFAVAMDSAGINGVTTPYTQQGLLQAGNSIQNNLAASTVPGFADVNQLKAIVDKVSIDLDTCAYITSPQLFALLETTAKFSGGTGWPIADRNQINGYKGFTTTSMPNQAATGGTMSVTSGGVMTLVSAPTAGAVTLGMRIIATGVPVGVYVGSLLSGTLGQNGSTYQLLINGANAACTTESTESFVGAQYSLLFGDFSLFEFCFQGPLEVMVDDITQFEQGITNLKFRQYFDNGILQSVAFAHCDNYQLSAL